MLQSVNHLFKLTIHATDGEIGSIEDIYFDDVLWTMRYFVVDLGKWLPGRRVLISPASARGVNWPGRAIPVSLTRAQVQHSPDVITDRPVSRQHEADLSVYYGWPAYWNMDPFDFDPMTVPLPSQDEIEKHRRMQMSGDPHLRSAREVKGYHIEARDGAVGHVSDYVFDDQTWRIMFLVVDTGTWLHHRLVLLKPEWIESISWERRRVLVRLTREAIEASPEFSPDYPVSTEYAERLVEHYRGIS